MVTTRGFPAFGATAPTATPALARLGLTAAERENTRPMGAAARLGLRRRKIVKIYLYRRNFIRGF